MNNSILGKNIYKNVINSYMKTPSSTKIKGTLLEADENKIKISVSDNKALNITLKEPIEAEIGDTVVVNKKDIVKSEIVSIDANEVGSVQGSQSKYDYILNSLDIPKNEESIGAVKTLDNYGLDITKENILSFMSAKQQLSNITEKLDYDTVVKLKDKNIDFEKESLQKVLEEMKNVQGEKRSF